MTFDQQLWNFDREAKFVERERELITGAAGAAPAKRSASRLDLARFYLSRDMFAEAKGVLDVAIQDDRPDENPTALVLRSFANIMLDRVEAALKDLANPLVGNQHDAQLWRALAYVRQGKWAEAREHFRDLDSGSLGSLPVELQRIALKDRLRAAVEVGDFAGAAATLNDLETIGVPPELEPQIAVLTGRVAEGLGRGGEALAAYRFAAASPDRPAAAQGRLRELVLRRELGEANKRAGHQRPRNPHRGLARRRNRDRSAATPGQALHRRPALPRRVPGHAHRAGGASRLRADPPHPRRRGGDLRSAVPGRQGRRRCRRSMR